MHGMYGTFTQSFHTNQITALKYAMHGWYGLRIMNWVAIHCQYSSVTIVSRSIWVLRDEADPFWPCFFLPMGGKKRVYQLRRWWWFHWKTHLRFGRYRTCLDDGVHLSRKEMFQCFFVWWGEVNWTILPTVEKIDLCRSLHPLTIKWGDL